MSFRAGRPRRDPPSIDLTPMIDVMFNLVLFFVVTTNFVQTEQTPGIQVDLPRSSAQQVIQGEDDLDVWMTAEGAVYLNDEPVDFATLRAAFQARAATDPDTMVVIKADEGVAHGRVVRVMDLAKMFGLSKLAIATEAPQGAGEGEVQPPR
ncbi:MAG: biopolymer transporter ExbD [Myxococcota bacterium]